VTGCRRRLIPSDVRTYPTVLRGAVNSGRGRTHRRELTDANTCQMGHVRRRTPDRLCGGYLDRIMHLPGSPGPYPRLVCIPCIRWTPRWRPPTSISPRPVEHVLGTTADRRCQRYVPDRDPPVFRNAAAAIIRDLPVSWRGPALTVEPVAPTPTRAVRPRSLRGTTHLSRSKAAQFFVLNPRRLWQATSATHPAHHASNLFV